MAGVPATSQQAPPSSSVFGPGVIGSDPTMGDASTHMPWLTGGLRGPADDTTTQSGVSQVGLQAGTIIHALDDWYAARASW